MSEVLKGVEHAVFFGTLLGLVREGRLVEYDDDIDIYVNSRHREEVVSRLFNLGYEIDFSSFPNKTKYFLQFSRAIDGLEGYIDIYFYDKDTDEEFIWDYWSWFGQAESPQTYLKVKKELFFPIRTMEFFGVTINVPNEKNQIVEYLYGKHWNQPLKKGTEYKIKLINNKPMVFVGMKGKIKRYVLKNLARLGLFKFG
jgi:hypothetical protein